MTTTSVESIESNTKREYSALREQLRSFLSGGFGGICLVLVGHPFDLVKVRLQTSKQYAGMMDAFRTIFRQNGVPGLYRGVSAPLLGVAPIFAVCFWGYAVGLQIADSWVSSVNIASPESSNTAKIMFAGAFSAIPTTVIMAPSERIKLLMQTSADSSFSTALGRVWREGGISSLYKGSMATLARDIPGSIAYFGVYEVMKKHLSGSDGGKSLNPLAVMAAGGLAGMANWAVAIPADVIKSRYQSAPPGTYSGTLDVLSKLLKHEGPFALFQGLAPVMLRAFPANAACFFGMEASKHVLAGVL